MSKDQMIKTANDALAQAGFDFKFTPDAVITEHMQYGGPHEGAVLFKLHQAKRLSLIAMFLGGRLLSAKVGARVVFEAV